MKWLDDVRNKPYEQRVRFVWTVVAVTAVILVVIWVVTWRVQKNLPKDTTLFDTIHRIIKSK